MTLEQFLREHPQNAFDLRAFVDESGEVSFYIHANDVCDDVLSFKVMGNYLIRI